MSMRGTLLLGLAVAMVLVLLFFDSKPVQTDVVEPPNPTRLRAGLVPTDSNQAVVVTADAWSENKAQVAAFERDGDQWRKVGGDFSARIGRNGFAKPGSARSEVTPSGTYSLTTSFGAVTNPGTAIPYRMVEATDCWMADPTSPYFNHWVSAPACATPNVALLETPPAQYELAIVPTPLPTSVPTAVDAPPTVVPFFLHRYRYSEGQAPLPTNGSVSMRREDLLDLLLWLDPTDRPVLVLGVADWLMGNEDPVADTWEDLTFGSTGDRVSAVQRALNAVSIETKVDGLYFEQTQQNVRTFQQLRGLPITGVVDADTARELGVYSNE